MRDDPILSSILVLRCGHRCPGLGVDGGAVMLINEKDIRILLLIARGSSASATGGVLKTSQPAVSRRAYQLDKELGGGIIKEKKYANEAIALSENGRAIVPTLQKLNDLFCELRKVDKLEIPKLTMVQKMQAILDEERNA